jgi:enoyl-CoA hydratase/carnithine racemase
MSYEATLELNRAVETVRDDAESRLLLIRGAGRAFCTGIDLKELAPGNTPAAYFEQWDRALRMLERMEKFVLCAMHGYALGGGLQLALASDIRIVTADCVLGLPAIQESIIPGLAPLRLPRYIGLGRAKWMILSGETVDGKRALELGLADHVVDAESFDAEVETLATSYLRTCSEGARQAKAMLAMSGDLAHAAFFEEYLRRQAIAIASPDHAEARAAYLEKRDPVWG